MTLESQNVSALVTSNNPLLKMCKSILVRLIILARYAQKME